MCVCRPCRRRGDRRGERREGSTPSAVRRRAGAGGPSRPRPGRRRGPAAPRGERGRRRRGRPRPGGSGGPRVPGRGSGWRRRRVRVCGCRGPGTPSPPSPSRRTSQHRPFAAPAAPRAPAARTPRAARGGLEERPPTPARERASPRAPAWELRLARGRLLLGPICKCPCCLFCSVFLEGGGLRGHSPQGGRPEGRAASEKPSTPEGSIYFPRRPSAWKPV